MRGLRPTRGASFTARLLAELAPHVPPLLCCRGALVDGMQATHDPGDGLLMTSRLVTARAALQSLHASGVAAHVSRASAPRGVRYRVIAEAAVPPASAHPCCSRSRLRGAFLATGTVSRPEAGAHLEIPARGRDAAALLRGDFQRLEIAAMVAVRRGRYIVTVRAADAVGDALTVIGAYAGRLTFEDGRVMAEMRSDVNRRINAETANLRRNVAASVRQMEAIAGLRERRRWDRLPPAVREAGDLRERHPDDTLEGLADRAGCSRSAMAGRLHRLVDLASAPSPG